MPRSRLACGPVKVESEPVAGNSILIVDDDTQLRELIGDFLRDHGYDVSEAGDVPGLRSALAKGAPDLIVLDVMMPGEDGLAALRSIPADKRPPVVMLSALGSETDRIVGLEMGADDYLTKPCNPRELLARIRAVLRRSSDPEGAMSQLEFGGWKLDPARWNAQSPAGEQVDLTTGEFRLFHALMRAGGAVLGREAIADAVGGPEYEAFDRAIDISVSRLRRKLADYQGGKDLIRTVRGEGYGLVVPSGKG